MVISRRSVHLITLFPGQAVKQYFLHLLLLVQGSKISHVRSYLRVPQAVGQVKILIFLVKIIFISMYAKIFRHAGQVPILRYFEACSCN